MAKVIVGMSGGVDSATAALLLREAGYEVTGVTLRTWESGGSRCCEIDAARATARKLGVPHYVFNCVSDFQKSVEKPFISDYLHGITPNPCVVCNREVKWKRLLYAAAVMGAESVATGHYARVLHLDNGRYAVEQAADASKDQSYMLYRLTQEQLSRTLFPLGNLTKEEVRRVAERAGLPGADSPDSQELCFVTEGNYADYVKARSDCDIPEEGNFVDENGRFLGKHRGIFHYTVGQRKGLGLSIGRPAYVKSIHAETNEIVIGDEQSLYCREILCGRLNFMGVTGIMDGESVRANVKIRYRHKGAAATLERNHSDTIRVRFDDPVKAATPGQSAVFYDDGRRIIGGGVIVETR